VLVEREVIDACQRINDTMKTIESSSRTSKLWINLLKCINLILRFIYAERSGDWELHIKTTATMLPFLSEDADYDIVNTALKASNDNSTVVVVGTDTDILVMLISLAPVNKKRFFTNLEEFKVARPTVLRN